jgi:phosphatidylglycerol---prolipoprotein diacylglyceryl transferase
VGCSSWDSKTARAFGVGKRLVRVGVYWYDLLVKKFVLEPHHLAWILVLVFIAVFGLSFNWLQSVFRGDVILNQTILNVKLDYLNLFGIKIPFTDFSIRFYSVFMLAAFASGYAVSLFLVKRSYLPNTLIDRLLVGIVLFGLLGARAFFVLFNLPNFFGNVSDLGSFLGALGRTFLIYEGGLAISGGILACVGYLWWFSKKHKFSFYEITDLLVPGLLIGQVIGRIGNFFNYEAYGSPTNVYWKMFVPENAVNANKYVYNGDLARYFHPTFMYEIIPNIIVLFVILLVYKKYTIRSSGIITAFYLICYGVIRSITELFRLDALKIPFKLNTSIPNPIANALGSILPSGLKEPFVYSLEHITINGILVSQLVAIGMVIIGVMIFRNRSGIIYSQAHQKDLNA